MTNPNPPAGAQRVEEIKRLRAEWSWLNEWKLPAIDDLLARLRAVEASNEQCLDALQATAKEAIAAQAEARRLREALGFIESASLFHPIQTWESEMKAQLRRIGMLAHDALTTPTPEGTGKPAPVNHCVLCGYEIAVTEQICGECDCEDDCAP